MPKKREFDTIHGQMPDVKKVKCKDCLNRLEIMIGNKDIGPINAYCHIYKKDNSDGKPIGILFKEEDCKYYVEDPRKI